MPECPSEKSRPCRFQKCSRRVTEPDLVLVALIGGREAQLWWSRTEEPALLVGDFVEYAELFLKMGMTALKAANCFNASTERFNTCFERDSLRVFVVHMR